MTQQRILIDFSFWLVREPCKPAGSRRGNGCALILREVMQRFRLAEGAVVEGGRTDRRGYSDVGDRSMAKRKPAKSGLRNGPFPSLIKQESMRSLNRFEHSPSDRCTHTKSCCYVEHQWQSRWHRTDRRRQHVRNVGEVRSNHRDQKCQTERYAHKEMAQQSVDDVCELSLHALLNSFTADGSRGGSIL
jgi:hypothetical protein